MSIQNTGRWVTAEDIQVFGSIEKGILAEGLVMQDRLAAIEWPKKCLMALENTNLIKP